MAKMKKMLALLLCAVMLFTVIPLQGFATEAVDETVTEESVGGGTEQHR